MFTLSLLVFLYLLLAGKPKVAGALVTICLMLGPDFISDTIVVETSDHARLKVAIAMNNVFRVCHLLKGRGGGGGGGGGSSALRVWKEGGREWRECLSRGNA